MSSLFSNIRFYILLLSFILSFVEYLYFREVSLLVPVYAYTAVLYLYIALLAGPVTKIFQSLPFRAKYLKARRAIGVSAFYFSLLHVRFAFFDYLGGFWVLPNLDNTYLTALLFSTTAFIILTLMAATSFDALVKKLTFPKWKKLHQLVYIAGVLIVLHASLIGSNFNGYLWIRIVFFLGIIVLLLLHGIGLMKKREQIGSINKK